MGAVQDGVVLGLYSSCEGHQFSFTAGGSLQHVGSKKCVNPNSGVSISHFFRLRLKWVHFKMVVLIVFAVVITTTSLGKFFECMTEYESWFFLCSLNKPVQCQVAVTVVLSCGIFISETNVGDLWITFFSQLLSKIKPPKSSTWM